MTIDRVLNKVDVFYMWTSISAQKYDRHRTYDPCQVHTQLRSRLAISHTRCITLSTAPRVLLYFLLMCLSVWDLRPKRPHSPSRALQAWPDDE